MEKLFLVALILTSFNACTSLKNIDNNRLINFKNGTVMKMEFSDHQKARTYAMERRLLILRKFEVMIEPYFGTANAQSCQSNLSSDLLKSNKSTLTALLQLPVSGEEHVIHDCLVENNTHWVNIELLVCDKNFYDIRQYSPIKSKPDYKDKFTCP